MEARVATDTAEKLAIEGERTQKLQWDTGGCFHTCGDPDHHGRICPTSPLPMFHDVMRHFGSSQANLFGLVAILGL